jgi:CheY-like chemotaxis protein
MKTRILIVEDDPDIAELVARYLERAGFQTERAANGREALQIVAARLPDLLILDLMLPQVDGIEICRSLRWRGNSITADHHVDRSRRRVERSSASNWGPTTISPSRSVPANWLRASGP